MSLSRDVSIVLITLLATLIFNNKDRKKVTLKGGIADFEVGLRF